MEDWSAGPAARAQRVFHWFFGILGNVRVCQGEKVPRRPGPVEDGVFMAPPLRLGWHRDLSTTGFPSGGSAFLDFR